MAVLKVLCVEDEKQMLQYDTVIIRFSSQKERAAPN